MIVNEKTFRDRGSGLGFNMGLFDFFYGNSKTLHKEVKKMIGQCDGFLHYSIALSEDAKRDLMPLLKNKREILDQIKDIHKSEGKLDGPTFLALKNLKKECVKSYNKDFNYMGKSFEEEYTPISFKIGDNE